MRTCGCGYQQNKSEKFEKEKERQLKAMDLGAPGFGLNAKIPKHKARNLAATETIPQNVNSRKGRHSRQGCG